MSLGRWFLMMGIRVDNKKSISSISESSDVFDSKGHVGRGHPSETKFLKMIHFNDLQVSSIHGWLLTFISHYFLMRDP